MQPPVRADRWRIRFQVRAVLTRGWKLRRSAAVRKAAYSIARDDALGRPVPRLTKAAGSGVRPLDLYVCRSSQSAAVACCLFRFYIIITVSTSHLYTEKIISSLYSDGVASMRTKCSHMVEALQAQARFCDELACACLDQTHAEDFRRKADKYRAAAVLISSNE